MNSSHITDTTLQAAVDKACESTANSEHRPSVGMLMVDANKLNDDWQKECPARLHLARTLLDLLPDPTPPVSADGKTPGQVAYNAFTSRAPGGWESSSYKAEYEAAASAVLAAFGNQSLSAAIARMEAVPLGELSRIWRSAGSAAHEDLQAVRARLIAAAKEGQAEAVPDLREALAIANKSADEQMRYKREAEARAEKSEAELANAKEALERARHIVASSTYTSQLRPIAEAGPVPDGCVRVYFYEDAEGWFGDCRRGEGDTHFADLRLPADEPTPEPLVTKTDSSPTWTPAVGDLVQLKSGGPVMTVESIDGCTISVICINSDCDMRGYQVNQHTLTPAKEEQP